MSLDKIAKLRLLIIDLEAEVMKTIDDGATLEEAATWASCTTQLPIVLEK